MPTLLDGKYEVLSKIKEGGMGAIFTVRHALLDEIRVVKTMRTQIEDDPDAKKRFYREAKLAQGLKHDNIASVIDFFEDQDHTFYMVMEYIEGENLSELIDHRGRLPLPTVLDIGIQTLDALAYLHKKGIIHRDISPENIMLTEDTDAHLVVKLIDLGVAKQTSQETMTQAGIFVGKLKYGSPEQLGILKKGEVIDGRSDIYSLGCVLYYALTGTHAFQADTPQSYITQHVVRGARPFSESDPEGRVPDGIRDAVMTALAKNRNDRWASADEMAKALQEEQNKLSAAMAGKSPSATAEHIREETIAVFQEVHDRVMAKKAALVPPKVEEPEPEPEERLEGPTELIDSGSRPLVPPTLKYQPPARTPPPARRTPAGEAEIWDAPTMHVDSVPKPIVPRPPARPQPAAGEGSGEKRISSTGSRPRRLETKPGVRPSLKADESTLKPVGSRRLAVGLGAAALVVAGVVLALVLRNRPDTKVVSGPDGTLLLTSSPWGRVASVVNEDSKKEVPLQAMTTPARLVLPPGRYRITLRGDSGSGEVETSVTKEVTSSVETPVHVNLPGFDLEQAVRSYVP